MAAMTFLQLAQRLAQECGVSNSPTSCQAQVGEMKRLVDWIATAYQEIQELHDDWDWQLNDFSFTTVAQQQLYTTANVITAGDFGSWKVDSLRAYTTGNNYGDEQLLIPVKYEMFRNQYMYGTMRSTFARPAAFATDPSTHGLLLGPIPDSTGWTVLGQYYRKPTILSQDSDVPTLPDRYHMAIVYKAMISYGYFEVAPEQLQRGQDAYGKILAQMEIDQIQGITFGQPLA